MRLGKTAIALDAIWLTCLEEDISNPAILMIVPKSTIHVWEDEFIKWLGDELAFGNFGLTVLHGNPESRASLWNSELIVVTTYGTLLKDINVMPKVWDFIILDEAHRIRNRKSKAFVAIKKLKTEHLYILTGTPASR